MGIRTWDFGYNSSKVLINYLSQIKFGRREKRDLKRAQNI